MSSKPIAPDSGLQRLVEEGYKVEIKEQHILVHDVPYVTSAQTVAKGVLVCAYIKNAESVLSPDNHQVWWTEDFPCFANGQTIEQIRNEDQHQTLFPGCDIRHRFSNKPEGASSFVDHYSKLVHYVTLIQSQAKALDPNIDARSFGTSVFTDSTPSPFVYADTASARASIQAISAKLRGHRVAIVGVGGTGAYILDQIAKTPVAEIHLFDGDVFQQHNAFRSPGAALQAEFAASPNKATYFAEKYSAIHQGIVGHPCYLEQSSINELLGMDFVFLSVDSGNARKQLVECLIAGGKSFIDVGLNLQLVPSTGSLIGTCRTTLCTPQQHSHVGSYVPMEVDEQDAIYQQNVQIADMNALNAQLAVIKWKQFIGFYQDDFRAHNLTFSVNSLSLSRDVLQMKSEAN